jgi:hypothetical protein
VGKGRVLAARGLTADGADPLTMVTRRQRVVLSGRRHHPAGKIDLALRAAERHRRSSPVRKQARRSSTGPSMAEAYLGAWKRIKSTVGRPQVLEEARRLCGHAHDAARGQVRACAARACTIGWRANTRSDEDVAGG